MNNTSHTNIGRSRLSIPLKALSAFLAAVMFFWPVAPVMGRNLPSGWNVVKGQVTVTVNGKTMTVDQATAKAIVNWDSFDVGKGYTVDINQISTKAAMLARVVGANASEILGSLKATGGLYLVNPNGILFGSGAVIDVNRLIASTYDISNDDFWSGNLKFQGDSGASVVNRATINAESAALIGKNVENYGTINASQAALVGAAGPVKLDNFGNGANLSIDFSGLTGAHDTKVVNEGTINAAGGEAILTAEAGKGLVEANNGTVVASSAEFSGKNSAPSNLGNLTADRILLDPEGSIVIGSLQAGGYKGKDGTRYAEYHPNAGGAIAPTLDAPYSASSNAECTTLNMTVYDKDGNGWTYTYSTEDVTDPLTGATHVQYNYGTPVCTYYNSKYLSGHLQTANWGFSYTSGGGWAGDATFTRGEGENLEQIMIGGTFGLNLEAERNLGILDYVHFNNPNDIKLQGGNLVIGDFASVEALGNVSIIANTALANTGRLDITTPKRVELFINGGEAAFGTLNITSFEDDIFLRTSNLNVAGTLALNAKHDIYATGEDMKAGNVNFTANAGDVNVDAPVTTKWMVLAAGRDVQINGAANTQSNIHITAGRDAVSTGALDVAEGAMTITAGRDATLAKLSTAHPNDYSSDVRVTAKNTVTLNGEVTGGRLWATATEGDVVIKAPVTVDMRVGATAGRDVISTADLTATDGSIEIIAGRDATLARLAAGPGVSSVNVNAGNDVTLNGTVDAWFVIIDAKNNATLNDDVTGGERVHASAAEGDLVVNGDVTANGTFVELLAGRDAEINGNINATNGLYGKATITAKNNATINGTIKAGGVAATATEGDLLIAGDVTSTRNIHDDATTFTAGRDVKIDGSVTSAGRKNATIITAGRDIIATADIANADESITATAGRDVEFAKLTAENGDLTVTAKDNATFNGAVSANAVAITATEGDLVVKGAVAANDGSGKFVAGQDVKIVKDGNVSAKGDLTVEAGRDIAATADITSNNGNIAAAAGRDASFAKLIAENGEVTVNAKNSATLGAITTQNVNVFATDGDITLTEDLTAKGINLAANSGNVTTEALTATETDISVNAGIDATFGDLEAKGMVLVTAKNNATLKGTATGLAVSVTATEGNLKATGDVKSTGGALILTAGQDVFAAGLESELGNVKVTAGRDAAIAGETKGREAAEIAAGRDATTGAITADEGAVMVTAKNNATVKGAINGKDVIVTATEGDLKAAGDIKSTGGELILTAGQDVSAAGLESELGNVNVTAGRDAAIAGETKAREAAVIAAGRDATTGAITADEDAVMVTAKNNATVNGAINGKGVMVAAADGDAKTGNIDAKSGHATVTAGQDATIGDVTAGGNAEIVAKRDATTGAITAADGSVTVVAKNNATIDGAINGRVVRVEVIEGDVSLKGDATASAGYLFVRAGQDAKVAADVTLKSETSYVSVVAGRDALVEGALEAEDSAEVIAVRDATTGNLTAGDSVRIIAKNNATANGDINASDAIIRAEEGDASVNANVTTTSGDLILNAGHNVKVAKDMHLDSAANVEVKAGKDAILDGDITAEGGTATITATNDVEANGSVFAAEDVTINAGRNLAVRHGVTSETGAIKMDAATGDMNINTPNGVTAAKEITLEAGIGNINIEGDSTIKGTDVTIHTATGNVTSGKNTTVEATTDNILVDASQRADMLGTLKAENGSVTVKAGLGATVGTVIAKDANIEANTGDIILEEDMTAGDINLDAKRGYVITKSLTATDDSITVNAGIDATLDGNLTAENGDVSVTAKNNAAITGTVTANEVTLTATEGDLTAGNDITANGRMATLAAGRDIAVAGGIKAPTGGVNVKAGRDASIEGTIAATVNARVNAGHDAKVGAITAEQGDAIVDAGSNIEMNGNVSANNIYAFAKDESLVSNGVLAANGEVILNAGTYMRLNGDVTGGRVEAVSIDNMFVDGNIEATGADIFLMSNRNARINGTLKANTDVHVDAIDSLDVFNTVDAVTGSVMLNANNSLQAQGAVTAAGDVSMTTDLGNLDVYGDVKAGEMASFGSNYGNVAVYGDVTADYIVASTTNGNASVSGNLTAEDSVTVQAGLDAKVDGDVVAKGDFIRVTGGRDVSTSNLTAENGSIKVIAGNNADLSNAAKAKEIAVEATADTIASIGTLEATDGDITLDAGKDVNYLHANASGNITADAGRDIRAYGLTTAGGDVKLTARGNLMSNDNGVIDAEGDAKLVTKDGDVILKATVNAKNVAIEAGRDANTAAELTAEAGDVIVEANSNVKLNGDVDASNIYVTAKEESLESNGVLTANGAIELFAGTHAYINNDVTGGNVRAITINNMFVDGNIEATDADIFLMSNRNAWINGTLKANTDVHVDAIDSLDVFNTVDAVTGSVMLNANNSLQAQGAVTAAGDVSMTTDLGNLDVYGDVKAGEMASFGSNYGNVAVYGDVTADYIVASTTNGNASVSGNLTAEDSVTVQAGLDAKVDGDVVAKGDFIRVTGGRDVSTSNLTAENGSIKVIAGNNADLSNAAKAKEIAVEATADTIASIGTLEATDGDITLDAGKDVNYLHANASGNITADAGRDIRAYGLTTAGGDVKLTARGNLMSNDNGVIDAEGDAKLVAKDGDVTLKKATVNAKNVTIEAGHDVTTLAEVTAEAGDVTVTAGRDAALAKLTAEAGDVTVTAKGNATFNGAVNATTVTATATEGDVNVKAPVTATEDDVILTARRDVVIDGGVVVAERDVLLTATDGTVYIGETVTANTGNVQATAGKVVNVDASVEATEGDVNFKAASDVYIFDPVKAGKTIDIISLWGDVYTSSYGDLTAENGFIMVSALSGNVELAGDATAENGDVIIYAGKDIDIHAPSNILAQNVNMTTAHGDVSNDGSIAAKGLEDSTVMVNANGNILSTGSIQADKAVQLISTKDIRNTGSIQAGTATEKPLTPGSVIEFNADGKATSTGSLVAETITGLAADDITITGELNTDYLNLKTTGSDGDITVETGHDIIAASLVTEGDQSDISFNGKNVDEMTAETKGTDADIDIKGGKMTIRKAVTFDGDVDIAGSGDLVLDVVEAKDGGKYTGPDRGEARHVNVTSGGMVKILTHVKADADVNIDARGPILDTDYAVITSGGDTSLTTGAYIGDVADGNPIHVEAEGTIYVNPRPGTPKVEYFAFVEGTSGDGQIHTKASSLPGLVIFNAVPWMGTNKQMGRLDRSYAEKFSAINGMLEVFNLSYPLVAEYRYFPHTILDLDGFTNAPRKGIEIIRMGGEKGGTINGLPEGLTPRNIPSVSDYEWTFLWPLDNEDADNAAEPVEATVSER